MVYLSRRGEVYADRPDPIISQDFRFALEENNSTLLDMNTGHPRRTLSPAVRRAIDVAVNGEMDYLPPDGSLDARATVARYGNYMMGDERNGHFSAKDVVITANGTDAFSSLIDTTIEEGKVALLIPPFYSAYVRPIKAAGGTAISVPASAANNFNPTFEEIVGAWEANRDNVTLILFPTGNPTGAPFTEHQAEEMARAIDYINKESGGQVTFGLDVVYHELSKGEDQPIYQLLGDDAQQNAAKIISASKLIGFTSGAGAVLTKNKRLRDAMEGARETSALSAPIVGEAALATGLDEIIRESRVALIKEPIVSERVEGVSQGGHEIQPKTKLEEKARSYLAEMRRVQRGIIRIAESYGIDPEGDEPIFSYSPDKALYVFPRIGKLFIGREVPDNVDLPGGQTLREYIGSDVIENDTHIERLLVGMAGTKPGAVGVIGRPGRVFGMDSEEGFMRFTCTAGGQEGRAKHDEFLGILDDAMQLLGAERQYQLNLNKGNLKRVAQWDIVKEAVAIVESEEQELEQKVAALSSIEASDETEVFYKAAVTACLSDGRSFMNVVGLIEFMKGEKEVILPDMEGWEQHHPNRDKENYLYTENGTRQVGDDASNPDYSGFYTVVKDVLMKKYGEEKGERLSTLMAYVLQRPETQAALVEALNDAVINPFEGITIAEVGGEGLDEHQPLMELFGEYKNLNPHEKGIPYAAPEEGKVVRLSSYQGSLFFGKQKFDYAISSGVLEKTNMTKGDPSKDKKETAEYLMADLSVVFANLVKEGGLVVHRGLGCLWAEGLEIESLHKLAGVKQLLDSGNYRGQMKVFRRESDEVVSEKEFEQWCLKKETPFSRFVFDAHNQEYENAMSRISSEVGRQRSA